MTIHNLIQIITTATALVVALTALFHSITTRQRCNDQPPYQSSIYTESRNGQSMEPPANQK